MRWPRPIQAPARWVTTHVRRVVVAVLIVGAFVGMLFTPGYAVGMVTDALGVTAFYAGAFFCGGYHLLTLGRWRHSEMGVNIMVLCASITALFGLRCLALLLGEGYPGQAAARVVLFAAIVAALIWRTKIMVSAQMANLRGDGDG